MRGADANSDHYMVKTRIRLRLGTFKNNSKLRTRLNVERLKTMEVRTKYNDCVRKKLNKIKEKENGDIENIWEQQKIYYANSAEEILGYRKGKSKCWISEDTWKLIEERKEIKAH